MDSLQQPCTFSKEPLFSIGGSSGASALIVRPSISSFPCRTIFQRRFLASASVAISTSSSWDSTKRASFQLSGDCSLSRSGFRGCLSAMLTSNACAPAKFASVMESSKLDSVDVSELTLHSQEGTETESDTLPILTLGEVASRLKAFSAEEEKPYGAMYSSVVGGITLDRAAMVVPLDDHMVHRGHAVFDTATIFNGYLYELDAHLDRLLRSASKAKLTPPFSKSALRNILVQTVVASNCREGTLRYWLSAGPGGFGLSPSECEKGAFYAVVVTERHVRQTDGVKVITSSIPIKPPQFATMKSTNYLPNAHVVMEANEKGAFQGIWLDQEGFVAEASNMNVAFVCKGELLFPSFANILSGCTAKRLIALARQLVSNQAKEGALKAIKEAQITVKDGKQADEMMLVVSSYLVVPVTEWDGEQIGNGQVGPVTRALLSLLEQDTFEGPDEVREPVPYKA